MNILINEDVYQWLSRVWSGSPWADKVARRDCFERIAVKSSASAENRNLSLIVRARRHTMCGSRGPELRDGVGWLWSKRGLASTEVEWTLLQCLAL